MRDELYEKFGLEFRNFSSELEQTSPSENPFEEHNQLINRLDYPDLKSNVHGTSTRNPTDKDAETGSLW
jgi:hypothetical protein